jgi:dTDP-4-dehydrorhamnose 3,5-epimerase-like enzyme
MAYICQIDSKIRTQNSIELFLSEFSAKRVFWIYNNSPQCVRGKHRHKKSTHILHCMEGSCKVRVKNGTQVSTYVLTNNNELLYLDPTDWREMYDFSENCILMCISNQFYDKEDYITIPYIA